MANNLKVTGSSISSSTKGMVTKSVLLLDSGEANDAGPITMLRFLIGPSEISSSVGTKGHYSIKLKDKSGATIDSISGAPPTGSGAVAGLVLRPKASGGNVKDTGLSDANFLVYDVQTAGGAGPEYTVEVMVTGKLSAEQFVIDAQFDGGEKAATPIGGGGGAPLYQEEYGGNGVYEATIPAEMFTS